MESLGAPLGGHICPTDNHSPAGHAQDGSSPSAPVDQVQEAMLNDLGAIRLNNLTLEDNKKRPLPITLANQDKSNSQDPDPKIKTLIKRYDNQIIAWQNYKPNDVDPADRLLDNLDNGQSHRSHLQVELAASKSNAGHSSRGGRAGGVSRGGGHVGQSSSRLDNSRGDRGPKASVEEIEALLRLPKVIAGSVPRDLDRPQGKSFSSQDSTATRGGMPTPTRGTSIRGRTSTRGTHTANDRSSQSKSTSTPTQLWSLATPETFFGSRTATPAIQPPVAANIPPAPPSETVVVIEEPSTFDTADSGYSGQNEVFSTNVKFEDFSEMEDRFVECCDGILTIFSTQDGTFHLKLIHKSGQQFLLIPFTLIAAYSIESKVDEDSEIEYLVINLRNSTDSGDISTSFRLRTLRKRSWNELMTIIRQNITAPVDATASAVRPTHENGVSSVQVLQEELISVNDVSDSITPEQGPDAGDSANMRDMWTLKDEERKLAERVVESTMQGMAKQAEQVEKADHSSSSVANEPIIAPSAEHMATAHVLRDDSTLPEVSLLRYGRSDMLRLKDRAASIDISTFPEEIRLSDAPKIDESQGLVKKKPKNNDGIDSSIWADDTPTSTQTSSTHIAKTEKRVNRLALQNEVSYFPNVGSAKADGVVNAAKRSGSSSRPMVNKAVAGRFLNSLLTQEHRIRNDSIHTTEKATAGRISLLQTKPIAGILVETLTDGVATSGHEIASAANGLHTEVNNSATSAGRSINMSELKATRAIMSSIYASDSENDDVSSSTRAKQSISSAARHTGGSADQRTSSAGHSINISQLKATRGIESSRWASDNEDRATVSIPAKQSTVTTTQQVRGSADQSTPSDSRSINISQLKATRGIESSRFASDNQNNEVAISASPSADQNTSSASGGIDISQLKANRGIESSRFASDNENDGIPIVSTPTKQPSSTTAQHVSSSSRRLNARSATFKAGSHASRTSVDGVTFSPTIQPNISTGIVSGYSPQTILASPVVRYHAIPPPSTLWAKVAVPNLQRPNAIKITEAVLISTPHEDVSAPSTIIAYVTYADELNPSHMKETEAVLMSPPRDRSHNYFYTHLFPDWHAPPSPGQPSAPMPLYHPQPMPLAAQQNYHPAGYPSIAAVHDGFPAHQPVYPVATQQIATVPAQLFSKASPRERGPNIRIAGATRVKIRSPLSTKPLALAGSSEAAQGKENDKGDI